MLQFMRHFAGSWFIKILFVILILSFGVWGIGDVIRQGGTSTTVAKVGKVDIDRAELDQEFRRQMERLRPLVGGTLSTEQARQFGLLNQSLNALIQRALYDQAAKDAGVAVGPDTIKQRIAEEPAFRDRQGQFDPSVFRSVLRNNQLTEQGYIAMLTRDTARQLVADAVGAGIAAPKPLVDELFRYRGEKRTAEVITLPNASVGDVGTPDDAEINKYYEDHQVRFTAPEYRGLTVVELSPDMLAKDITIPDDQLRAAYGERASEFTVPERRTVVMAVADDEAKARQIAEAAKTKGLTEAAKAAGTDTVTLDNIAQNELPEVGDAAFKLTKDAISEPIKSALGWHVLTVTAIQPGSVKSFESVRAQLLAEMRKDKALDSVYSVSNTIDDQLAGGASLDEVAQSQKLKLTKIAAIDSTGKGPDGKDAAANLPNLQAILKTAFQLASGATSDLTEGANASFYAVHVDAVTPAAVRPKDSVRDQIVAGWQDDQRATKAVEKAKQIADALKDPKASAQDLATRSGGSYSETVPFERDAQNVQGVPGDLAQALFTLKPGETTTASEGDHQVIARLKEIVPADPKKDEAGVAKLAGAVTEGLQGDIAAEFTAALRTRYPVEIFQSRIDQFFASN